MNDVDQTLDESKSFTAILDRMQLLGDDFTAHADDQEFLRALADGTASDPAGDVLPDEYCTQLELPPGTSYAAGARKLIEVLLLDPGPGPV